MERWIVGVTNNKGGVGKSTIACCLAVQAARARRRTLLVDMDVDQQDATAWLTGRDDDDIVSGTVYETDASGLGVVWVADLADAREVFGEVGDYDAIVIDGRPSGPISAYVLGLADLVLVPYVDATGRKHGEKLAAKVKHGAVLLENLAGGRPLPGRRAVLYDDALEAHRWHAARADLLAIVEHVLREARDATQDAG